MKEEKRTWPVTAVSQVCQDAADNAALRRLRPHPLSINQSKDSHRNKRLITENKKNHGKTHFLGENLTEKKTSNISRKISGSYTSYKGQIHIFCTFYKRKRT